MCINVLNDQGGISSQYRCVGSLQAEVMFVCVFTKFCKLVELCRKSK
jgi:hypothetical protein